MKPLLLTNALIISEDMRYQADILIDKGRIQKIASFIPSRPEWLVIDVRGKWVIPGMIDDQVHFREPGLTHKGTIATESAAAVMGGITSFMEMPNVTPPTTTRQALREKFQRASRSSLANHSFYFGATNDNLDELKALTASQACGVKVFMGASTGNMLVDDEQVLESIFANQSRKTSAAPKVTLEYWSYRLCLANIRSRSCAEQNEGLAYTTRVNCAETTITLCADSISALNVRYVKYAQETIL